MALVVATLLLPLCGRGQEPADAMTSSTHTYELVNDVRVGSIRKITAMAFESRAAFVRRAKEYFDDPEVKLGRLLICRTSSDRWFADGVGGTDSNFGVFWNWLKDKGYSSFPFRCPEVQEAIKIGKNIAVRFIDSACRVKVEVIGEGNPMRLRLGAIDFDVVSMNISDPGDRPQLRDFLPVNFFVHTSARLDMRLTKDLLDRLLQLSGALDAAVVLRNDRLFMNQSQVPVVPWVRFLFDERVGRVEYEKRNEHYCVKLRDWPIRCTERP